MKSVTIGAGQSVQVTLGSAPPGAAADSTLFTLLAAAAVVGVGANLALLVRGRVRGRSGPRRMGPT